MASGQLGFSHSASYPGREFRFYWLSRGLSGTVCLTERFNFLQARRQQRMAAREMAKDIPVGMVIEHEPFLPGLPTQNEYVENEHAGRVLRRVEFVPTGLGCFPRRVALLPCPGLARDGQTIGVRGDFAPTDLVATGGPNSEINAVGFREHVQPAYQGLRHIPGNGPYPIVDSFYVRGFGVGVRHPGAAVVAQITNSSSHTAPTFEIP